MPEQINLVIRLGKDITGEQRREDYETAAIKAGFTRVNGQGFTSSWARDVLDREARMVSEIEAKEDK